MLFVPDKQIPLEHVTNMNKCPRNSECNGNIPKGLAYLQRTVTTAAFITTIMVQGVQLVQKLLIVWKCIVLIPLRPQFVPTVKGLSGTHRTTELTLEVMIKSSVYKLALGEVTALDVTLDTVTGSWRQIADVCRGLLENTVK